MSKQNTIIQARKSYEFFKCNHEALLSKGKYADVFICTDSYTCNKYVKKVYKNKKVFDQEKNILALLEIFNYTKAVLPIDVSKNTFVFQHYGESLEQRFSRMILPEWYRHELYGFLKSMLVSLHKIDISHGDFKAKNIMLNLKDEPLLIDFDSGVYKADETQKQNDEKKLKFIYRQLWFVRPADTHHWPYNNHDKSFRNGEQIWNNGPEVRKDNANLRNVL